MTESAPTLYTSRSEIESIFSIMGVNTRVDDDHTEAVDTAWGIKCAGASITEESYLDDIIEEATDYMNQYLLGFYKSTDLANSRWVRRRCSYIACYFLSQRRGNPAQFTTRFEEITAELGMLARGPGANGNPLIPRVPLRSDNRPSHSNISIDDRFPYSKIRVQRPTSSGRQTKIDTDYDDLIYPD